MEDQISSRSAETLEQSPALPLKKPSETNELGSILFHRIRALKRNLKHLEKKGKPSENQTEALARKDSLILAIKELEGLYPQVMQLTETEHQSDSAHGSDGSGKAEEHGFAGSDAPAKSAEVQNQTTDSNKMGALNHAKDDAAAVLCLQHARSYLGNAESKDAITADQAQAINDFAEILAHSAEGQTYGERLEQALSRIHKYVTSSEERVFEDRSIAYKEIRGAVDSLIASSEFSKAVVPHVDTSNASHASRDSVEADTPRSGRVIIPTEELPGKMGQPREKIRPGTPAVKEGSAPVPSSKRPGSLLGKPALPESVRAASKLTSVTASKTPSTSGTGTVLRRLSSATGQPPVKKPTSLSAGTTSPPRKSPLASRPVTAPSSTKTSSLAVGLRDKPTDGSLSERKRRPSIPHNALAEETLPSVSGQRVSTTGPSSAYSMGRRASIAGSAVTMPPSRPVERRGSISHAAPISHRDHDSMLHRAPLLKKSPTDATPKDTHKQLSDHSATEHRQPFALRPAVNKAAEARVTADKTPSRLHTESEARKHEVPVQPVESKQEETKSEHKDDIPAQESIQGDDTEGAKIDFASTFNGAEMINKKPNVELPLHEPMMAP